MHSVSEKNMSIFKTNTTKYYYKVTFGGKKECSKPKIEKTI